STVRCPRERCLWTGRPGATTTFVYFVPGTATGVFPMSERPVMLRPGARLRLWSHFCLALVVLELLSGVALAYPQYIGRCEMNCADCHYRHTGGGLVNGWGRESREATFGEAREAWPLHGDVTGFEEDEATFDFDVGADVRLLP